ncbi:MAG TPA: hypothetical protein VK217_02020 [Acidimicrobiales bacterium]|nr:hypothetical protein [Acidimicrobiales bacterium]
MQADRQRAAWGDDLAVNLARQLDVGPDLHLMSLVVLEVPVGRVPAAGQHATDHYAISGHVSGQYATGKQCPAQGAFWRDDADVQEAVVQPRAWEQHESAWQDPDVSHHDRLRPPDQRLATVEAHLKLMGLVVEAR